MLAEMRFEVDDIVEALRDREGIFKVTSPDGYIFRVTCRRGQNMHVREIGQTAKQTLFSEVAHHEGFEGQDSVPLSRRWQIEEIT